MQRTQTQTQEAALLPAQSLRDVEAMLSASLGVIAYIRCVHAKPQDSISRGLLPDEAFTEERFGPGGGDDGDSGLRIMRLRRGATRGTDRLLQVLVSAAQSCEAMRTDSTGDRRV